MPNRQLTSEELKNIAYPLIAKVRTCLKISASGDPELLWALRRKVFKELMYDERGKPMHRVALKKKKVIEQNNQCAYCKKELPKKGCILDRLEAMVGYTLENTRVLCPKCDIMFQAKRGYK